MRIIAGEWRGRVIEAPGQGTRPTADRVRETLFSMLASRIGSFDRIRVADLFAGSGALGFEALSRGAAGVTFVEKDGAAAAVIRRNADKLGATERVRVLVGSADTLPTSEPFDLILADPPYARGSGTAVAAAVVKAQWTSPATWIAIETERGDKVDAADDWVTIDAERDVGRARITLLRCS